MIMNSWPRRVSHLGRRRDGNVLVAVERHEALVPGYLGQVVLVGVPEIERPAERAATRRPADIGASANSGPAEEVIIVWSKCAGVFEEFLRHVVAYVESVGLVVARACRVCTLA